MTETKALTKADLRQFAGSECWHRHSLARDILYTDGVKYVAETAGAYWLIDEIALAQRFDRRLAATEVQVWTLRVNPDRTAMLKCEDGDDGDDGEVLTKAIAFTDFPLDEIVMNFANNIIYLPNED